MPPPHLTDRISILTPDTAATPEDIFAAAPGLIFPDDTCNLHGDAESTIVYRTALAQPTGALDGGAASEGGKLELRTADPTAQEERGLFSHYLWNAGISAAGRVEEGQGWWGVRGERVLEVGAGVGLVGIVAALAGAEEVVITDYPSDIVLANLRRNASSNIPADLSGRYSVEGHAWGALDTPFATAHAHRFTRILAADCFWMPSQHTNLVQSLLRFLTPGPEGRVLAVGGFHTGRAKLAAFFDVALEEGLEVEEMFEEDVEGARREWMPERDGGRENQTERKKWLVVATLKRKMG